VQEDNDGYTGVNYPQSVFSGIRKTVGFKCDTGLHREFKRVSQAKMGSVCRPLECFEIAFLALIKEQVNFGTTVHIEKPQCYERVANTTKNGGVQVRLQKLY
jgi:hypothetical protein